MGIDIKAISLADKLPTTKHQFITFNQPWRLTLLALTQLNIVFIATNGMYNTTLLYIVRDRRTKQDRVEILYVRNITLARPTTSQKMDPLNKYLPQKKVQIGFYKRSHI